MTIAQTSTFPVSAEVYRATDPADAVRALAEHPGAALIAGGTDVMLDRRLGRLSADLLIDISRLDTGGITFDGDHLVIGATSTIRSIEINERLLSAAPALVEAARVLGSIQIRNMATLGGNLCHATPSAEMPPPLLVLDASVRVVSPDGERSFPLTDLATGPGSTSMNTEELMLDVTANVAEGTGSCYIRQTIRWAMDLAGVGVAASVQSSNPETGEVAAARVALGAVSPTPILIDGLDDIIVGRPLDPDVLEAAAEAARNACSPISDARGTADYRRHVVGVLTQRALRIADARARGLWPEGRLAPPNGFDLELLPSMGNGASR